ncbi:MAG: thioredoxin domain-containing protein [Acidobacteriota bacterium]
MLHEQEKPNNRLAHEKSPYLQQHATNPVDWYPWGQEAFDKAKRENKPIFLSIGYSTCHWCHVMERESFEDEETAAVLNEHFVPVKVDREERPDVDDIYMTALTQVLGQPGGWPMSMWLTPDLKPFFGGTYFPPEDNWGRPGFRRVLELLAASWKTKGEEIAREADEVTNAVQRLGAWDARGDLDEDLLSEALPHFERSFDEAHGAFGGAPKFPQPSISLFLLRLHARTQDPRPLEMVESQLVHMANGGIYDHLGGGFARYSTDARWLVPHFEKMLYDNAQLLRLYAEAYQITGRAPYERVVRETADYLLRDMQDPDGGFYSAEDADSEGVEGKFYVWTRAEVESLLGESDARIFGLALDVTEEGNWEEPHSRTSGLNILNVRFTPEQIARLEHLDAQEVARVVEAARRMLFEARSKRTRPLRDDKILTSWNGLAISGMAAAARALREPLFASAATRAAEFISSSLYRGGSLHSRFRLGEAKYDGTLADYALFVQGLLDLYETSYEARWLRLARELNTKCIELFYDADGAGFFFTAPGRSDLIARQKEITDGALPAGNSVAVLNLVRLAEIFSDDALRQKAAETLRAYAGLLRKHPSQVPYLAIAHDHFIGPSRQIVIAGERSDGRTRALTDAVQSRFLPRTVVLIADGELDAAEAPAIQSKQAGDSGPLVYVCRNFTCKEPVSDVDALLRQLEN